MSNRERLEPGWSWIENYGFAAGMRSGNSVYTCGMVAFDAAGNIVGEGDMLAQARQVYANIREVLVLGGASMDDVVKTTTHITDMSRYADYATVRAEAFPNGIPPSTTVHSTLVLPELLIEIEAVALIG